MTDCYKSEGKVKDELLVSDWKVEGFTLGRVTSLKFKFDQVKLFKIEV